MRELSCETEGIQECTSTLALLPNRRFIYITRGWGGFSDFEGCFVLVNWAGRPTESQKNEKWITEQVTKTTVPKRVSHFTLVLGICSQLASTNSSITFLLLLFATGLGGWRRFGQFDSNRICEFRWQLLWWDNKCDRVCQSPPGHSRDFWRIRMPKLFSRFRNLLHEAVVNLWS